MPCTDLVLRRQHILSADEPVQSASSLPPMRAGILFGKHRFPRMPEAYRRAAYVRPM